MKSKALFFVTLGAVILFLPAFAAGQDLAAIARAQKAPKEKEAKEGKKPAKVFSDDDVRRSGSPERASGSATRQTGAAESAGTSANAITAFAPDGRSVFLAPGKDTDLIFMATWCPHSKHLKQLLNDARTKPYLTNHKLVFLFSDEWRHISSYALKDMKEQNVPAEAQAAELKRLKDAGGSPYMYERDFFADLPGEHYFCDLPPQVDGFPTVWSSQGFTSDWTRWLAEQRNVPVDLTNQLAERYDPDK